MSGRAHVLFRGLGVLLLSASMGTAMARNLSVRDFGAFPNDGADDYVAIQAAVNTVIQDGGGVVSFDPGVYDIYMDLPYGPINGEGIVIANAVNVHLRGNGARIVGHNFYALPFTVHPNCYGQPFQFYNSQDVSIDGFTLEPYRPMHTPGTVVRAGNGYVDLAVSPAYWPSPLITQGEPILRSMGLRFNQQSGEWESIHKTFAFVSAALQLTASDVSAQYGGSPTLRVTEQSSGPVVLAQLRVGDRFGVTHARGLCGFTFLGCYGVTATNLTHRGSAAGLLTLMQCGDVTIRNVSTELPDADAIQTTIQDGIHLGWTSGFVEITDCPNLINMNDELIAMYCDLEIVKQVLPNGLDTHGLHASVWPGDTIEVYRKSAPGLIGTFAVQSAIGSQILTTDDVSDVQPGDLVFNSYWRPSSVLISNCHGANAPGSGIHINNGDYVEIRDCTFRNILGKGIGSDAMGGNGEGPGPTNIVVRNCTLKNCSGGWTQRSALDFKCHSPGVVHNVVLHYNTIDGANYNGVFLKGVTDAWVVENQIGNVGLLNSGWVLLSDPTSRGVNVIRNNAWNFPNGASSSGVGFQTFVGNNFSGQ